MSPKEIQKTKERYTQRLNEFGISEEALGWGKKGRAKLRYKVMTEVFNFNGTSILDFGAGFGLFNNYLKDWGIEPKAYKGIEINDDFISKAKEIDPNIDITNINIYDEQIKGEYDYVVSSGVFNHQLNDNDAFIDFAFEYFFKLCNKGIAFNFLSDKVDFKLDYTHHSNPEAILKLAYKFTNRIVLRNDYMPFEFTIFLFKEDEIHKESTVYLPYHEYI